jgi:glyoxylase-like metal-dependent hydrolase (beta-lactamase superfamily II)
LEISVNRQRHNLQSLPSIRPTLPNQTFDGKIVFHGTTRSAELVSTGKGHTDSDCIVQLPKDRITFIGDLGFFQQQPFTPYGSPPEWITLLNDLANGKTRVFVSGHGPLGSKADLLLNAQYIQAMEVMVQQVIQRGGTITDALCQVLPPPFDAWQGVGRRFEANVRGSFQRQREETDIHD